MENGSQMPPITAAMKPSSPKEGRPGKAGSHSMVMMNQGARGGVGEQHLFEKLGGLARHVEVGIELAPRAFLRDEGP